MDTSNLTNVPHIEFRSHLRTPSHSPSRSPTRQRITDDILSDLSPATTLEAFTSDSPSGRLRASVEAATPSERAFGIRATLASKKIQEWVDELEAWPWPDAKAAAEGFELPAAKRIKLDPNLQDEPLKIGERDYMGSLPAQDVMAYERRIDEIQDDMEDLDVEGIKKYVLNTHFSSRSRPSSSASEIAPMPSSLLSYTKMDDFTAIVTATVLRALPNLSQLMRLLDIWSIRLSVLRKVPPLLGMLDDAENALKSGWQAISIQNHNDAGEEVALDRQTFETMRDVLQDIVTTLGRDLDYMLDTLEGRQDTLPERWLDRMEEIEREYGEWVVSGDRKVREGEWARMAKRRGEEVERLEAERVRKEEGARLRFEEEAREVVKMEYKRLQKLEEDRLMADEKTREAARLEAERIQKLEVDRLRAEEAAREAAKLEAERLRKLEEDRLRAEEEAREAARLEAERLQRLEEDRLRSEKHAAEFEAQRARKFEEERLRLAAEALGLKADHARRDKEEELRLEEVRLTEATRLQEHARDMLEFGSPKSNDEVPPSTDTEQHTLSPLEFVELPPNEYECRDPDHDISNERTSSSVVSDPLIAAGAFSLATALGMKVHDSDAEEEREELSLPQSSPISRYAPFDGNSDSKVEDAESIHEANDRHYPVENDIPLRIMQKDLPTHDAVLVSVEKIPSPTASPKVDTNDSKSPPLPKEFSESGSAPALPISPPNSKFEDMPSLPNPWEDHVPEASAPSQVPTSESGSVSDYSRQHPTDDAPSTPTPLPKQRQENEHLNMQFPVSSMVDDESIDNVSDEFEHTHFDEAHTPTIESSWKQKHLHPDDIPNSKKGHGRNDSAVSAVSNVSTVSGYSTSDPSPEIYQAEPAEYFRPVLSPIKSTRSLGGNSGPPTPVQTSARELPTTFQQTESPSPFPGEGGSNPETEDPLTEDDGLDLNNDGAYESKTIHLLELENLDPAVLAEKPPISTINTINHFEIRRDSSSSNDSTIITKIIGNSTFSPVPSSPGSIADTTEPFPDVESPSAGRVGLRNQSSHDYSPPDSPPPIPEMSKRRSLHLLNSPNLVPSSPLDTPITPTSDDAPSFPSLEISPALFSSPKKANTTDDQLQAQISTLLESIPARIRLTSEPDTDSNPLSPFSSSQNDTLRPKKTRRSLTPSIRSSSSMSMRAPTPSFTLAPAYGKSAPRPRHQNGNPEIKLYHLSRSTGEAPIKLFVRLVGENGERVMVRVGGGWADLGEYLREYASHHGRRVVSGKTNDDKVEIQDLPSRRDVSNSSVASSNATVHGNDGRSSPIPPRPNSVLERERPMSSLFIRKTRKSVGEQSESSTSVLNLSQSPSTPASPPRSTITNSNSNSRNYDTPPGQRSVSRLSWTEEESVLGLAGPKSKPKLISERDQEWVESMKEKVRLASVEKEKIQQKREGGKDGKMDGRKSFGELEKVGGTKRLFKKSS
jgi:hypothetical protein